MVKYLLRNMCLMLVLVSSLNCSLKPEKDLLDRLNSLGIEYNHGVIDINSTDLISKLIFHDGQVVNDFWQEEVRELFSTCEYGIPDEDDIQITFKYAGRINISNDFESHLLSIQVFSYDDAIDAKECYLFTFKNKKVVSCLNVASLSIIDGVTFHRKSLVDDTIIILTTDIDDVGERVAHYDIDTGGKILLVQQ